jgi:hypothetical protein
MTDNFIAIGDFVIFEPTTVVTDVIISAICFFCFLKLKTHPKNYWHLFFLFFGLSTFLGAFSHALFEIHEGIGYKSFWLSMQLFNGLAVLFAQQSTFNKKWNKLFLIQLFVFAFSVFVFQKFLIVIINNALSLIPIMIYQYRVAKTNKGSLYIANGILISFATALIHGFKISFHTFFNYNDIAHLFIMLSLYTMYYGININLRIPEN